jgi:hypothetical protein
MRQTTHQPPQKRVVIDDGRRLSEARSVDSKLFFQNQLPEYSPFTKVLNNKGNYSSKVDKLRAVPEDLGHLPTAYKPRPLSSYRTEKEKKFDYAVNKTKFYCAAPRSF